jgi:Ca2+-binding EF-hand superfamily protein
MVPRRQSIDFGKLAFDAVAERRPSQLSCKSDDDDVQSERNSYKERGRRPSILEHIAPKNPLVSRMQTLDSLGKEKRKLSRMQALLDVKRQEFEKRPEAERQQLSEAFQKHDSDNSGSLDHKEILACLTDLGLKPHTHVETREMRRIINEVAVLGTIDFLQFVFEMIPRAREKLRELRKGPLLVEFRMFDRDENGFLDRNECMLILEMLCTANLDGHGLVKMKCVFEAAINDVVNSAGQLDFDAFEELVSRAREEHRCIVQTRLAEIYREEELDFEDLRQHADEIVLLFDSFKRMDTRGVGNLGWDDIRLILIEYDLLPREEAAQNCVIDDFAKTALFTDGKVRFQEFLRLLRTLRKEQLKKEEHELKEMFNRLDKDRSETLEVSEVSRLLEEFGVQPQCWEDQMQIRRMLDQIDEDQSGNFSFDEFCRLVQRVREYLATVARRRQRVTAERLGFADRQVAELRDVFFALDSSQQGCLTIDQLRKALDNLRVPMSPEDLHSLVADYDTDGSGMLDFHGFLRFFKAVAPSWSSSGAEVEAEARLHG